MAKLFKYQGETISYLWSYNSKVAKDKGFEDLSQTWLTLDQIYKEYIKWKEAGKLDNKQHVRGASRLPTMKQSALTIPISKLHKLESRDMDVRILLVWIKIANMNSDEFLKFIKEIKMHLNIITFLLVGFYSK